MALDLSDPLIRRRALRNIWRAMPNDYRMMSRDDLGKIVKMVLIWRRGVGTCLVPLDKMSDDEIIRHLPARFC